MTTTTTTTTTITATAADAAITTTITTTMTTPSLIRTFRQDLNFQDQDQRRCWRVQTMSLVMLSIPVLEKHR